MKFKKLPPTDGLWSDNRTDEEQMGANYNDLEWGNGRADAKSLSSRTRPKSKGYYRNLHELQPSKPTQNEPHTCICEIPPPFNIMD